MKQTSLKKSARLISVLLNIGCVFFGVLSAALTLGVGVLLCAPLVAPEAFASAWSDAVQAGQTLTFGQAAVFFLCCLGELICIFLALYHARKIFRCIGQGNSPFTPATAAQIRKIALFVLLFAVVSELSVFKMLSLPAFILCAMFVLILFCISLIFEYGCQLQQEVDETL